MPSFASLVQQGAVYGWFFIPSALALGALHGLEPGHSKTMMAAFIVAVRGTVLQAVLLGVATAVSHSLIVWMVAIAGMYLGQDLFSAASEPYFQLASAILMIAVGLWMLWRLRPARPHAKAPHGHRHDHGHDHDHHHGHDSNDAHERAHAEAMHLHVSGGHVTTGQIAMFGLTGGLIPCPAAITVLLLCLQLKEVALGITLVTFFSIGLAATLVLAGVLAALGVRHASQRWAGFDRFSRRAAYLSPLLIIGLGVVVGVGAGLALIRGA